MLGGGALERSKACSHGGRLAQGLPLPPRRQQAINQQIKSITIRLRERKKNTKRKVKAVLGTLGGGERGTSDPVDEEAGQLTFLTCCSKNPAALFFAVLLRTLSIAVTLRSLRKMFQTMPLTSEKYVIFLLCPERTLRLD